MHRIRKYVKDIQEAKLFDIQNVADYFYNNKEEYWNLEDMTLAPPFNLFATKWRMPRYSYSDKHGRVELPKENWGNEFITLFRVVDKPFTGTGHIPLSKWYVDINLFAIINKKEVYPPTIWSMAINDLGILDRDLDSGKPAFYYDPIHSHAYLPVTFLQVSGLALTFLHAKNVEIIEPIVPRKNKKPTKRKPFESYYHRLKVNAIGGKKQYPASEGKSGISQGLHIVRGHFREYGINGKGKLFGKYSGKYWIASHAKGDESIRTIDKDYEVR